MRDDNMKALQQEGKHVIVFAGPNGSGKTSLIDEVKETGLKTVNQVYAVPKRFINPDQVAKDLQGDFPDQHARDVAAARAAVDQRREAIKSQKPFAFETVMSHTARISELLTLKEQGYHIVLTFITTDDPEKNVGRVKLRYETGTTTGHYVPPDKVRERYIRTLDLLPKAAEIADTVFVYDNSVDFEPATLQALIDGEAGLSMEKSAKNWVRERLIDPLQRREQELQDIVEELGRREIGYIEVDELHGAYVGEIIVVGRDFIVQIDQQRQRAVIHDRLMLDTSKNGDLINYAVGCVLEVSYSTVSAPNTRMCP